MSNVFLSGFMFIFPFLLMRLYPIDPSRNQLADLDSRSVNLADIPFWENPLTWAVVSFLMAILLPCSAFCSLLFPPKDDTEEDSPLIYNVQGKASGDRRTKPKCSTFEGWCEYCCRCCYFFWKDPPNLSETQPQTRPTIRDWGKLNREHDPWKGYQTDSQSATGISHRGVSIIAGDSKESLQDSRIAIGVSHRGVSIVAGDSKERPQDSGQPSSHSISQCDKPGCVKTDHPSCISKGGMPSLRALPNVRQTSRRDSEPSISDDSYEDGYVCCYCCWIGIDEESNNKSVSSSTCYKRERGIQ